MTFKSPEELPDEGNNPIDLAKVEGLPADPLPEKSSYDLEQMIDNKLSYEEAWDKLITDALTKARSRANTKAALKQIQLLLTSSNETNKIIAKKRLKKLYPQRTEEFYDRLFRKIQLLKEYSSQPSPLESISDIVENLRAYAERLLVWEQEVSEKIEDLKQTYPWLQSLLESHSMTDLDRKFINQRRSQSDILEERRKGRQAAASASMNQKMNEIGLAAWGFSEGVRQFRVYTSALLAEEDDDQNMQNIRYKMNEDNINQAKSKISESLNAIRNCYGEFYLDTQD